MKEVLDILNSFINYEKIGTIPRDLENFKNFLKKFDNPQHKLKNVVHVVGTKGKGSVSFYLSRFLINAGFKVGTYISPHLVNIRERIMLDLNPISENDFVRIFHNVYKNMEIKSKNFRTFFETLTAMAFLYFLENNCDYCIIEAGLGGRLDATNVFDKSNVIITKIHYDHMNVLGDTLDKIAFEKASVIKKNSLVFTSYQEKEVMKVINDFVMKNSAELFFVEFETINSSLYGVEFRVKDRVFKTPLVGSFHAYNASLSIIAFEKLTNMKFKNELFKDIRIPGRFEVFKIGQKTIVLDVAHNYISILETISNTIDLFHKEPIIIFSLSKDKDLENISRIIKPYLVLLPHIENPRLLKPHEISEYLEKYLIFNTLKDAIDFAMHSDFDIVLITGSNFLVSEFLGLYAL
ncbi:MAG: Mur ligase family protein [candidate division WOR-3 bacterium]|nr:Mur ligase family protein [candidate division WOR-3 bacterium]MCX7947537.1 Mur ligase family protein [candidate division WOR-3 bacterium]MDW8150423.1 Mur ligase family protein [candidate division WOR-3 bacterium]